MALFYPLNIARCIAVVIVTGEMAYAEGAIRVSDAILCEDMECFKIETPHATYFYGKRGAGFASIMDPSGRDWVSYRHGGKSLGEYRGLPKCGQPVKYFHCGYGFGRYANDNWFTSQVVISKPDHVRIHSVTKHGDAECAWDFFATHATLTLTKIPGDKYWFVYEGTPGGELDVQEDYVIRSSGKKTQLSEPWKEVVPWVAFGDEQSAYRFVLMNHQSTSPVDSYVSWPYKESPAEPLNQMTVFGFGRPDWLDPKQHTPPLTGLPASFSIGFTTEADAKAIGDVVRRIETRRVSEKTSLPPIPTTAVKITNTTYEGRPHFQVETVQATYYFDCAGGGFSRIIDRDNKDWISFHKEPLKDSPAAAAAGFRGIPNAVFGKLNPDAGAGHPGHDQCESVVMGSDTIHSSSKSGTWKWTWKFTETNAIFTMDKASTDHPWWFLYEGTPGGRWAPKEQYWGTNRGGPRTDHPYQSNQLVDTWNWAYFGENKSERVLLIVQVSEDTLPDTMWYMGSTREKLEAPDGMIVFGFGRGQGGNPQFRGSGQQFLIGLVEGGVSDLTSHHRIAETATRWQQSVQPKMEEPLKN